MAQERMPPDAVLSSTNYSTLNLADIDEDPDSPDANWGAWDGNGNTNCRTSFGTPTQTPSVGADLQQFRVQIRKTSSGGNSSAWSLELWENGVLVRALATGTTTSTAGEVVSGTWNANELATADGSLVECALVQTDGGGGSPSNRRGIEVGAVEWNAEVSSATVVEADLSSAGAGSSSLAGATVLTTDLASTGAASTPLVAAATAGVELAAPAAASSSLAAARTWATAVTCAGSASTNLKGSNAARKGGPLATSGLSGLSGMTQM